MYTRSDYMSNKCTHREYYAQFVNEATRARVLQSFSIETLRKSYAQDEHFNTKLTPMKTWDAMGGYVWRVIHGEQVAVQQPRTSADILPIDYTLLRETGEGASNATLVCIYKEAARQLVEGGNHE